MKYDKSVNSVKRYTLLNCNIYNFCADFVNIVKIVVAHYNDVNFMALNLLSIQYHLYLKYVLYYTDDPKNVVLCIRIHKN